MKLNALTGLSDQVPGELNSVAVTGLASNSSEVQKGFLFFGLPGINVDGARFVGQAAELGACAAVVSDQSDPAWSGCRIHLCPGRLCR